MHARVFLGIDVRNQKGYYDRCSQQTFWQRIRARYGANPRCAQLTSQMWVTPLISKVKEDIEVEETDSDILRDYCWSTINGFKGVLHRWPADLAMKLQTKTVARAVSDTHLDNALNTH